MPVTAKTIRVTFSDQTMLDVSEETWNIAMKLTRLEGDAVALPPLEDEDAQMFRTGFYPKLVAATVWHSDTLPDEETTRNLPIDELNKWFMAVKELNPAWWVSTQADTPEAQAEVSKKKRKRTAKS